MTLQIYFFFPLEYPLFARAQLSSSPFNAPVFKVLLEHLKGCIITFVKLFQPAFKARHLSAVISAVEC